MSKAHNSPQDITPEEVVPEQAAQEASAETVEAEVLEEPQEATVQENENLLTAQIAQLTAAGAALEDKYLRLAAEYDNYRKRTAKEKEALWSEVKSQTALEFLPIYDNLERALKQETADAAYKKGVEMTMTQLRAVLEKLGITEIPAQGQPFDPNLHNAVMHVEDEALGENVVVEVFQTGFMLGEKVIRFATVKVAN